MKRKLFIGFLVFVFLAAGIILGVRQFNIKKISFEKFKEKNLVLILQDITKEDFAGAREKIDFLERTILGLPGVFKLEKLFFPEEVRWLDNFKKAIAGLQKNYQKIQSGIFLRDIITGEGEPLMVLIESKKSLTILTEENLSPINNELLKWQEKIKNWSIFLGEKGPQNFLFLFQNQRVSRPTGGVFEGYALISFYQGKIVHFESGDIKDLDNLFLEKIIPPAELQFTATNWSFNNLNWFFDFPVTAEKVIEFYETTGLPFKINGVAVINFSVIEEVLKSLELTTTKPLENFSSFLDEFYSLIKKSPSSVLVRLLPLLNESLTKKEIQLYSKDEFLNRFFQDNNWAGSLASSANDYLAVTVSSLNPQKIHSSLRQYIVLESQFFNEGTIRNKLTFKITAEKDKKTPSPSWYYLKIFLPQEIKIIEAKGGRLREIIKPSFYEKLGFKNDPLLEAIYVEKIKDAENNIEILTESNKTAVGTWLTLQPGQTKNFILTYELPIMVREDNFPWSIIIQKQSGQQSFFKYQFNFPKNWDLKPHLEPLNKEIVLEKDLLLNFNFDIHYQR